MVKDGGKSPLRHTFDDVVSFCMPLAEKPVPVQVSPFLQASSLVVGGSVARYLYKFFVIYIIRAVVQLKSFSVGLDSRST